MSYTLMQALVAFAIGFALSAVLFVPFVAVRYRRDGRLSPMQLLLWTGFLVYAMALWTYTLLPLPSSGDVQCVGVQTVPGRFVSDIASEGGVSSLASLYHNPAVMQAALNVVLFLPLGFFLRALWGRGIIVITAVGFAVSLLIETTQLTGVWGVYPCAFRLFDVDDLIMNTAGAFLGGLLSTPFRRDRARAVAPPEPGPVTRGRRLIGMISDALVGAFLGTVAAAASTFVAVSVRGVPPEALSEDAAVTAPGVWAPVVVIGLMVLVTGRTPGDMATAVRFVREDGRSAGLLGRVLRFAGGIGGWQLLSAWGAWTGLFALVCLVLMLAVPARGGLPGILSRTTPVDARLPRER
ncbi:VanZ family protein [Microbacterium sp. gxy059]|uniref:VanZ family protein n=1 Tax=Microbacterium sp. gxy059 TaxID=2957199 RepID=UPI003D9682C8